jgi:hypothetical protein
MSDMIEAGSEPLGGEWVLLPGGELEARRPRAWCRACRAAVRGAGETRLSGALCFECYRAERRREAALSAAGRLFTGSAERLQAGLPFEPVNRPRLARLRMERLALRTAERTSHPHADRRRRAQLEARRTLSALAQGLWVRAVPATVHRPTPEAAARAAAGPFPESWLPFVVGR